MIISDHMILLWGILNSDLSPSIRKPKLITSSSSRTGCYFFPSAGKSNQKEPPLKDKKLKTNTFR